MSAEELGSNLLREVKIEGLNDVLRIIRYAQEAQQPRIYTGNRQIDQLLDAFIPPSTTSPALEQHGTFETHHPPVLELTGATPCSGKKQLLYHLVACLLLPATYEYIPLSGLNSAVVLYDLSHNFSLLRLRDNLANRIHSCTPSTSNPFSNEATTSLIHDSLTHLHVFRPPSTLSLIATLSKTQSYLYTTTAHLSANRPLGALILNGLDAFLHQDRLEAATTIETLEPQHQQQPSSGDLLIARYRTITSHLLTLQRTFPSCPIIATTRSLSHLKNTRISNNLV
ncbi:MAG: hypothetical protein Q9222_007090, partial [Ikaeria aurantiellina]